MPRWFDFIISIAALIIISPLLLITFLFAAVSTLSFGIFVQTRIGQHGKPFTIYKLQTMQEGKITKIGKYLRNYKIDELPQLFNILKGDMSFVGARPDVPGYYDQLKGEDRKVLTLKPGLTSLAAIKYRHEEQLLAAQSNPLQYNDQYIFPDKVKMNLEYLEKRSLWYDIKIIGLTIKSLFN
ncbi:sugar transferase [Nonlabens ulvanivorans]|uniref:sugar transferase n=1 Tax=Nonlabens ulvanivorans TaxID=906888 RepID=UPI0037C6FAC9